MIEDPQKDGVAPLLGGENKSGLLDQMRHAKESTERNRAARLGRPPRAPEREPLRFADLPEHMRLRAQRTVGEIAGIANPFYRSHDQAAGATTLIGGREFVNFASYDYLATNTDAAVARRAKDAIDRYGISASASRLVAGERHVHLELEDKLARLYRVDAAVCFVSGYLTNVTTISCLMGPQDVVIHDELIHNSALAGIKQSGATRRLFKHNDMDSLENVLRTLATHFRRVLVIVEGIYSMDGDVVDLPGLLRLRSRYGFWLMVDEAHALGVLGDRGRGTFEHFGVDPKDVDIWMGTLSKTASSCGGYIAGTSALVDLLKADAGGFVYSVGMAPVLAAAALASIDILEGEPQRIAALRRNGEFFLKCARQAGLDTGLSMGFSVVPVIVGDSARAVQLSNRLADEGVNVLPIIHPAVPEGMARLRYFITCNHTQDDIRRSVEATAHWLNELRDFGVGSIEMDKVMPLLLDSWSIAKP